MGKVCVTGNTVIDALKEGLRVMEPSPHGMDPFLLLDMHRRETNEMGMDRIAEVVLEQAKAHGLKVYWPAHPSPKVQSVARSFVSQGLKVLPPLDYLGFINLMQHATLILTDSGGVVEEAITVGTPTLQLRDHTDRQEAIDYQCSWLASTNPEEIERLLAIAVPYAPSWKAWMKDVKNPYGNGDAGEKSVAFFCGEFNDVV
jgi:UDP-N-acetylglucosamine 2-epimerase (non-hydrolysing)